MSEHIAAEKALKAKLKTKRGKKAKLAFLKRSAAAKAPHHQRRGIVAARHHLKVTIVLGVIAVAWGGWVVARAADLVPPAGPSYDLDAYIRAAQADRPPGVSAPDQVGRASWYALGLRSPDALTCASTRFPRGTRLEVTDLRNGRKVVCLVNDYGPAKYTNRVVDLSRGSYRQLEGLGSGTLPAEIRVVH
jgi:rare lipoprotein A (peptidoglycan hydrolase)